MMSLCVIKKLSLLTHSLLEVLCSMSVSQRRDEVMSPLFGRSLSSRPRFSLSHSLAHSHTERRMLPRVWDQSTTIPAMQELCTFKCSCMLWITLTADGLCLTTPGLAALPCFLGQLLLAALHIYLLWICLTPPSLSGMKLQYAERVIYLLTSTTRIGLSR